jgi:hypothetical protein
MPSYGALEVLRRSSDLSRMTLDPWSSRGIETFVPPNTAERRLKRRRDIVMTLSARPVDHFQVIGRPTTGLSSAKA